MADDLTAHAPIDGRLREAFAATPRHMFVPAFYRTRVAADGATEWAWDEPVTEQDPAWLSAVYADDALATQHKPRINGSGEEVSSSSTKPSLMADMIAELGIEFGMTVLEVGTGTGYNAAVLCHFLGDDNVTTIDIDTDLVDTAIERLAAIGFRPSTEPRPSTHDRVLATVAVDHIPHNWVR